MLEANRWSQGSQQTQAMETLEKHARAPCRSNPTRRHAVGARTCLGSERRISKLPRVRPTKLAGPGRDRLEPFWISWQQACSYVTVCSWGAEKEAFMRARLDAVVPSGCSECKKEASVITAVERQRSSFKETVLRTWAKIGSHFLNVRENTYKIHAPANRSRASHGVD